MGWSRIYIACSYCAAAAKTAEGLQALALHATAGPVITGSQGYHRHPTLITRMVMGVRRLMAVYLYV
jgi:hypothetical protein